MRCDACGTMNKETSRFCLYCGAPLTTVGAEAAPATLPPRAVVPPVPRAAPPRPVYAPRPRAPDFVGLFGVAFFFLVLGVVFYLNGNLLTELRRWWDQILAGRAAFRPPEGVIVSAGLFWGLLGVSNFGIAFLRWFFTRSRIRTLGALLGGIAMVTFSYFLYRYSVRDMSGSLVVSLEAAVIAVLLFVYIGSGLYWTTPRWRPAVEGMYRTPRP
jgi:hypothetical protein